MASAEKPPWNALPDIPPGSIGWRRYVGIEVDDALEMSEQIDLQVAWLTLSLSKNSQWLGELNRQKVEFLDLRQCPPMAPCGASSFEWAGPAARSSIGGSEA